MTARAVVVLRLPRGEHEGRFELLVRIERPGQVDHYALLASKVDLALFDSGYIPRRLRLEVPIEVEVIE